MISKSRIKLIKTLEKRKYRLEHKLFVAEGPKLVGELIQHLKPAYIAAQKEWIEQNRTLIPQQTQVDEVLHEELERASLLRAPQSVLALFPIEEQNFDETIPQKELCIALDDVQDPGNLGTITRIADWFGIRHIFCSPHTADIYNPKAVQATMGALARVKLHYCNLEEILSKEDVVSYGTFLDGQNIYSQELENKGVIVMGNEGNGISANIEKWIDKKLFIPNYPIGTETTESLNVAIATSIVCAEFRRRHQ
jgi:TrmH family RNA methyltransferase